MKSWGVYIRHDLLPQTPIFTFRALFSHPSSFRDENGGILGKFWLIFGEKQLLENGI